jgi:hypothetical protein
MDVATGAVGSALGSEEAPPEPEVAVALVIGTPAVVVGGLAVGASAESEPGAGVELLTSGFGSALDPELGVPATELIGAPLPEGSELESSTPVESSFGGAASEQANANRATATREVSLIRSIFEPQTLTRTTEPSSRISSFDPRISRSHRETFAQARFSPRSRTGL